MPYSYQKTLSLKKERICSLSPREESRVHGGQTASMSMGTNSHVNVTQNPLDAKAICKNPHAETINGIDLDPAGLTCSIIRPVI